MPTVIPTNARRCRPISLRSGSIRSTRLPGMSADFASKGFLEITSATPLAFLDSVHCCRLLNQRERFRSFVYRLLGPLDAMPVYLPTRSTPNCLPPEPMPVKLWRRGCHCPTLGQRPSINADTQHMHRSGGGHVSLESRQSPPPGDVKRYPTEMTIWTETQPSDYVDAFDAAIGSWWYYLTFLLPGLVYLLPAAKRWRYILWLVPVAFIASCFGYLVYWRSIDWAFLDYYERTGYLETADTWYVFMPFIRGIPNALAATTVCTISAWAISCRPQRSMHMDLELLGCDSTSPNPTSSNNPYEPPRTISPDRGEPKDAPEWGLRPFPDGCFFRPHPVILDVIGTKRWTCCDVCDVDHESFAASHSWLTNLEPTL
ncbi:hypothetical protein Poly51_59140 [Rubripirellula tenax]|uniref:Uncharacterized protein n=1 Tax=Rubripirellula tenax TaxID=2528015 RepID=A0A5C6E801_9BACT|nr:hypothetical protein Poly51_59140 [Rubripirellula tenax]